MSEKTAFGGVSTYQHFKETGLKIATESKLSELKNWLHKLNSDEQIEVQQAAAVCHSISDHSPELFIPFIGELIKGLRKKTHPSGPRFTYRLLAEISIPEVYLGELLDLSFKDLSDYSSPIAIRVFAMSVIAKHVNNYPELKCEFEAVLRVGYGKGSAGYKSRARKIAKSHGLRIDTNL